MTQGREWWQDPYSLFFFLEGFILLQQIKIVIIQGRPYSSFFFKGHVLFCHSKLRL